MNCFIPWFRARGTSLLLGTVWSLVFCASLAAQDLSFTGLQSTLSVTVLPEPNGIAIDASGNRYFVDQTLANVIEVSASGTQTSISSTLSAPTAIAVDSTGNLYVADTGNHRVLKIPVGGGAQTGVGSGFSSPKGVALDSLGNVYVADPGATPAAVWKVAVGGGAPTRLVQGSLSFPVAVATDGANNLYILDDGDGSVVKVSPAGSPSFLINNQLNSPSALAVDQTGGSVFVVSTGHGTLYRFAADREIQQLGTALGSPTGVAVDSSGRALVTDFAGAKVDIISPGAVDMGQANLCSAAQLAPCSQQVVLNFIVGNGAGLSSVNAQAVTQGSVNLDFNATANTCTGTLNFGDTCAITVVFKPLAPGIRLGAVDVVGIVTPNNAFQPGLHPRFTVPAGGGALSTVFLHGVGVGPQIGFDAALINNLPFVLQAHEAGAVHGDAVHPNGGGGPRPTNNLQGLTATSNGDVYVIDSLQCIVDKFTAATSLTSKAAGSGCSTSAGDSGPATSAVFRNGYQVAVNGRGDIYIPDLSGSAIRKVDALTGIISTVAGILNSYGYTAGPVAATSAKLSAPAAMAVDNAGNFYWADNAEYMVRKVDVSTGILTTVAGSHVAPGYSGDGGPATSAVLGHPGGIALDGSGNLYIADASNNVIREVSAATGIITTIAGSGPATCGYGGDHGPATSALLCGAFAVAVDAAGNVYIDDGNNGVVRKVNASSGDITTAAGLYSTNPPTTYTGNGGPATLASLVDLVGVTLDGAGNLYVTDGHSNVIRKITAAAGIANFATFSVANSSPAQDITVTNNGNAILDLSGLAASTNFNLSGANTSCSISTPVDTGGSCVLGIEFLPTVAGALTGSVTLNDNVSNDPTSTQSVSLTGTGTAQVATQLALAGVPSALLVGGNLGTATVDIEDAYGHIVTASSAAVTLTITGPNGYSQTVMATAASGVAAFNLTSFALPATGSYTVTAISAPLTSVSATSAVSAATATQLALAGVPATLLVGGNLGTATVDIEAANGMILTSSSATVTLTITGPNGYSQAVMANAAAGIATFNLSLLVLSAAGTYTVTATSAALTPASATVAVSAANPAKLALAGVPATVLAGGNPGTATVNIEATNGVTVTSSSATVTLTITGPNSYSQVVMATAVNGIATFNLTLLTLPAAGTYTVTASSAALTAASATVVVTAAPAGPAKLALAGVPATVVAGSNLGTATVSIEAADGSVVTGSSATVTLTINGPGGFSQAVTATAVGGTATFNITSLVLPASGTYTVTASSATLTAASATVVVTAVAPASPTQLALAGVPSVVVVGASLGTATVSLEAANGTVVSGSAATVTLTISGPNGYSQGFTTAAVSGIAAFNLASLALPAAGTYTVTANSAGLPAVSVTIVVTAATPPQDFTLNFTTGTTLSPAQTVVPGSAAVFPFTLAPATGNFAEVITLSATSPLVGATYSFSPPTVTPGSNGAQTTMTVETVKPLANLEYRDFNEGYGTLVLGLLLLPFAGSRRWRRAAQQSPMRVLTFALLSLGLACAATGCAPGGLFSHPSNTYIITVTGTSGALSHSTTVTLIEE